MDKVYQNKKRQSKCFYSYCESQRANRLMHPWPLLLRPLSMLPAQWFPQTFKILEPFIKHDDVVGAHRRLHYIYQTIQDFGKVGLSFTPRTANISGAFQALSNKDQGHYKTQSNFERHVIQMIEYCARILLIHNVQQSPISDVGRMLLRQRERNSNQLMRHTRAKDGTGTLASVSKGQSERQAAEQRHRAQSLTDYYVNDCGYSWLGVVITPGPEHSPGHGQDLNPAWHDADCPSPKDTHVIMMEDWANLRSACAQDGVILRGFRTVEAFKSGTPHYNNMLFFKNEEHEQIFIKHLRRIFPESHKTGFKKSSDQRIRLIKDDDPNVWANYIQKELPRLEDDEGNNQLINTSPDSDWCSIWNVNQYEFFGQQPIKYWRLLQRVRNSSKILLSDDVPSDIKNAYKAAKGSVALVDGRITNITHDYRAFLRLTEETSPAAFKSSSGTPAVQFKRTDFRSLGSVISVINQQGAGFDIAIPRNQIKKFDVDELAHQRDGTLALQLSIRLPTTRPDNDYYQSLFPRQRKKAPPRFSFGFSKT